MRSVLGCVAVALSLARAGAAPPVVSITLGSRQGHVTPVRQGFTHTGGGNIDIAQPAADTVIITMTGAAMAGAHPCKDSLATVQFDLMQDLELSFSDPQLQRCQLTLEARLVGLLRSRRSGCCKQAGGSAELSSAHAVLTADCGEILALGMASQAVGGDDLAINDHEGPMTVAIGPGK